MELGSCPAPLRPISISRPISFRPSADQDPNREVEDLAQYLVLVSACGTEDSFSGSSAGALGQSFRWVFLNDARNRIDSLESAHCNVSWHAPSQASEDYRIV